jgi:tetratricopeptide (TPR) repeat protein
VIAAQKFFEESLQLFRDVGWRSRIALVLNGLGELARANGDYERADALYQEGFGLYRELGDKMRIAVVLNNLGFVALHREDTTRARTAFAESLELWSALDAPRGIPESLVGLAGVIATSGKSTDASRLLAAAIAFRDANRVVWEPRDRAEFERTVMLVRAQLDQDSFDLAWAKGSALTQQQAVAHALAAAACIPQSQVDL